MAEASTCSGFCGRVLDVPEMTAAHTPVERLYLSSLQLPFSRSLPANHTAERCVRREARWQNYSLNKKTNRGQLGTTKSRRRMDELEHSTDSLLLFCLQRAHFIICRVSLFPTHLIAPVLYRRTALLHSSSFLSSPVSVTAVELSISDSSKQQLCINTQNKVLTEVTSAGVGC